MTKPAGQPMPVPPQSGKDRAAEIHHDVHEIAGGATHQMRSDDFKQQGPDRCVEKDFTDGRRLIALAQSKQTLQQQKRRQCAGNEQKIVEMKPQKRTVYMRFDEPTIQRVERTCREEQRIAEIAKPLHNASMIKYPKTMATMSFKAMIMASYSLQCRRSCNCLFEDGAVFR